MAPDSSREKLADVLGTDADQVLMERGYSLGFVGVHGQVRLFQFRVSKRGFSSDRAADDTLFAEFLDHFCANVERMLRERWGGIALRVAFDGEGELIGRLYDENSLTRCDAVGPANVTASGLLAEPAEAIDAKALLMRASAGGVENWGIFESARMLDDGGFAHELRCQALVADKPA